MGKPRLQELRYINAVSSEGEEDFLIELNGVVSFPGQKALHHFFLQVISPRYLTWMLTEGDREYLFGHGFLLVNTNNRREIDHAIRHLIEQTKGDTWEVYQIAVGRYVDWID